MIIIIIITHTCNSQTKERISKQGARKCVTFFVRYMPLRIKYEVHLYVYDGRRRSDGIYNAMIIASRFKSDCL
jgi:hypothetical protein